MQHSFRFWLPIYLLFFIGNLTAQSSDISVLTLKGRLLERNGLNPVSYGNIGLKNKPFGTVSDSAGYFAFACPAGSPGDSIQISRVGYKTVFIPLMGIAGNSELKIMMEEEARSLPEITILPSIQRNKTRQIGRQSEGKLTQVSIHKKNSVEETLGSEMGMRYSVSEENAILKDFNFHISASNFNHIRFRLNVYSVKNGLPDTLIYPGQILADLENFKTGWTKVELESYQIPVQEDMVITLQWVEHRMDYKEAPKTYVPVAMSLFSKDCFVRVASQDVWKRMGMKISSFITIAYP